MMEVDCEQEQDAMPSPFPGMDPFGENGELWSEVHSRLIVAIADAIAPELLPNYYVTVLQQLVIEVVQLRAIAAE
jgi:hypothetical protein